MDIVSPRIWPIDLTAQRTSPEEVKGVVIITPKLGLRSVRNLHEQDTLDIVVDKTRSQRKVAAVQQIPLDKAITYLTDKYFIIEGNVKQSYSQVLAHAYKLISGLNPPPEVTVAELTPANAYK